MTENEFLLADRIQKIKSMNELYDLENNAYISFSGGKDSTVLHYLIDEALPNNKIPRVFINTGMDYKLILKFVRNMAEKDSRFTIWTVGKNIKETLNEVGYPFKSKLHSQKVQEWRIGYRCKSILQYFRQLPNGFNPCPQILMYQIDPNFKLPISNKCCNEFKKKPALDYIKQSGRKITITGMMKEEGGERATLKCVVTDSKGAIKKFHPMAIVTSEFEEWYIKTRNIKLCELYYPPYNFVRTGCVGCPYAYALKEQLEILAILLPSERKRAEYLWKPVYDEYRRIGYRLDNQPTLFE